MKKAGNMILALLIAFVLVRLQRGAQCPRRDAVSEQHHAYRLIRIPIQIRTGIPAYRRMRRLAICRATARGNTYGNGYTGNNDTPSTEAR